MSENTNEQMDLESGATTGDNNITDVPAPTTDSPNSEVTTTEKTSTHLKISIKTPKEKKDISVDGSSSVKQVI
jgi:hypothetical protein